MQAVQPDHHFGYQVLCGKINNQHIGHNYQRREFHEEPPEVIGDLRPPFGRTVPAIGSRDLQQQKENKQGNADPHISDRLISSETDGHVRE